MDFKFHDELCPKVWEDGKIKPEIRARLLDIAAEFVDFLGIDAAPVDVIVTGSLANYNYTDSSDIDLHVVFDSQTEGWVVTDGAGVGLDPVIRELFTAKKTVWNESHDIKIAGHEVELYAQDMHEPHASTGIYSLTNDEWVIEPSQEDPFIDLKAVKSKADTLKDMIDNAVDDGECSTKCLESLKVKMKALRQSGLESGGEFSTENLAFKLLRRSGHLDKLHKAYQERYDKEYSMESYAQTLANLIMEFTSVQFKGRPNSVPDNLAGIEVSTPKDEYLVTKNIHAQHGEKEYRMTRASAVGAGEVPSKVAHTQGESFEELLDLIPDDEWERAETKFWLPAK